MRKKRYSIERRKLSAYTTIEVERMAHLLHTLSEAFSDVGGLLGVDVMPDLEEAIGDELADIGSVVQRIERRLGKELASRS